MTLAAASVLGIYLVPDMKAHFVRVSAFGQAASETCKRARPGPRV
jgi:hypothetical protein